MLVFTRDTNKERRNEEKPNALAASNWYNRHVIQPTCEVMDMRLPALCRLFAPVSFSFSFITLLLGMLSCLVLMLVAMLFVTMLAGEGVELREDEGGTFSEPTTNMGLGVISNPFFL